METSGHDSQEFECVHLAMGLDEEQGLPNRDPALSDINMETRIESLSIVTLETVRKIADSILNPKNYPDLRFNGNGYATRRLLRDIALVVYRTLHDGTIHPEDFDLTVPQQTRDLLTEYLLQIDGHHERIAAFKILIKQVGKQLEVKLRDNDEAPPSSKPNAK